jgi:hypothetical protein
VFCDLTRDEAIAAARCIAEDRVVQAGAARDSHKTVDGGYADRLSLPGNAMRVRVRVAGATANPEPRAVAPLSRLREKK